MENNRLLHELRLIMGKQNWYEEYEDVRQEAKRVTCKIGSGVRSRDKLYGEKRFKRPKVNKLRAKLRKIEMGEWTDKQEAMLYLDEAKQLLHAIKMKHSFTYRWACKARLRTDILPDPKLTRHRFIPDPYPHTKGDTEAQHSN